MLEFQIRKCLFCFNLVCADPDEFERIYEPLDVKSKKIHIVDSGLTFNLPYPLILRPQRGVDLIISFDFSARPSDSSPPFKVSKRGHSSLCVHEFNLTQLYFSSQLGGTSHGSKGQFVSTSRHIIALCLGSCLRDSHETIDTKKAERIHFK